MDEILASATLSDGSSIHIATLSRKSVINSNAEHLGFGGYFIFEALEGPYVKGISILAKVTSLDAAFRLIDLWGSKDNKKQIKAA